MKTWAGLVLVLVSLSAAKFAQAAAAQNGPAVRIEQVVVGFDGHFRTGHLVPVFVQVNNTLPTTFDGELQAIQKDDDGDRIRWRADAPIRPRGAEWRMILICPRHDGTDSIRLDLVDRMQGGRSVDSCNLGGTDDRSIAMLGRQPQRIDLGDRVVGVMGTATGRIGLLRAAGPAAINPTGGPQSALPAVILNENAACIAVPQERFPAIWQGLDMIDVLYWDSPSAGQLDVDQQRALAQWVFRGGQLVVGLGMESQGLVGSNSDLAKLLPVEVLGVGETLPNLDELGRALLPEKYAGQFTLPATVATVKPKADAQALQGGDRPLVFKWARGAGSVTVMCTTLTTPSLVNAPPAALTEALARLLGFGTISGPINPSTLLGGGAAAVSGGMSGYLDPHGIGPSLVGLGVLMLLAYALLAGPGTWLYAQRRNQRQRSWWFFGAVVGAATLASLLLSFFAIRGQSVTAVTVLDLPANSSYAVCRGYCGVYVPAHRRAKVEVAGDENGLLSPMIEPDQLELASFPDVRDYDIRQESLTQITPPIRRTIKQFELSWRGDLGGAVKTDPKDPLRLHFDGNDWQLSGTLINDLPADLLHPVLICLPPASGAGMMASDFRKATEADSRWCRVYAIEKAWPNGQSLMFDSAARANIKTAGRLDEIHRETARTFGGDFMGPAGRREFFNQALLLSTMSMYEPPSQQDTNLQNVWRQIRRDCLVRWDRSDEILAGKVLLVAEASNFFPPEVRVDGQPSKCGATTVVRVLLDCSAR